MGENVSCLSSKVVYCQVSLSCVCLFLQPIPENGSSSTKDVPNHTCGNSPHTGSVTHVWFTVRSRTFFFSKNYGGIHFLVLFSQKKWENPSFHMRNVWNLMIKMINVFYLSEKVVVLVETKCLVSRNVNFELGWRPSRLDSTDVPTFFKKSSIVFDTVGRTHKTLHPSRSWFCFFVHYFVRGLKYFFHGLVLSYYVTQTKYQDRSKFYPTLSPTVKNPSSHE